MLGYKNTKKQAFHEIFPIVFVDSAVLHKLNPLRNVESQVCHIGATQRMDASSQADTFAHRSSPFISVHHHSSPFITVHHRSSPFISVHLRSSPFIGICNPDAVSIRICNPIKAHYKCLHSMRADSWTSQASPFGCRATNPPEQINPPQQSRADYKSAPHKYLQSHYQINARSPFRRFISAFLGFNKVYGLTS